MKWDMASYKQRDITERCYFIQDKNPQRHVYKCSKYIDCLFVMAHLFETLWSKQIPASLCQNWVDATTLARELSREQVRGVIWVLKHVQRELLDVRQQRHASRTDDCGESTSNILDAHRQTVAGVDYAQGQCCDWCGHFAGKFRDELSYMTHVQQCARCPPEGHLIIEGISRQCEASKEKITEYTKSLETYLAQTSVSQQDEITLGSSVKVSGLTDKTQYNNSVQKKGLVHCQ